MVHNREQGHKEGVMGIHKKRWCPNKYKTERKDLEWLLKSS